MITWTFEFDIDVFASRTQSTFHSRRRDVVRDAVKNF